MRLMVLRSLALAQAPSLNTVRSPLPLDDGVEMFVGTFNVKFLSVLFVGDDSVDTDEGYEGKIQFAYVMIG